MTLIKPVVFFLAGWSAAFFCIQSGVIPVHYVMPISNHYSKEGQGAAAAFQNGEMLSLDADADADATLTIQKPVQPTGRNSSLWVHDVGTSPMQIIVLSPTAGLVVGIVSPIYRMIPMYIYTNKANIFALRHNGKTYNESQTRLPVAEVIFCDFNVGYMQWHEWRTNPPDTIVVLDTIQRQEYSVSLLVDPALQQRKRHYLSATTTIRKSLWHYIDRFTPPRSAYEGSLQPGWDDDESTRRALLWIQHHKTAGVEHFYVFDNENNVAKPNIRVIEDRNDVTYIRAPGLHYDAFRLREPDDPANLAWGLAGQVIIENALIRMAYSQWLLVSDSDELFVPAATQFDGSLVKLIQHFETMVCGGLQLHANDTLKRMPTCQPLANHTSFNHTFSIDFAAAMINETDHLYVLDWLFRKVILQPELTRGLRCHFSESYSPKSGTVLVPPSHGFIAQYRIKNFSEDLLRKAKWHAPELKEFDY